MVDTTARNTTWIQPGHVPPPPPPARAPCARKTTSAKTKPPSHPSTIDGSPAANGAYRVLLNHDVVVNKEDSLLKRSTRTPRIKAGASWSACEPRTASSTLLWALATNLHVGMDASYGCKGQALRGLVRRETLTRAPTYLLLQQWELAKVEPQVIRTAGVLRILVPCSLRGNDGSHPSAGSGIAKVTRAPGSGLAGNNLIGAVIRGVTDGGSEIASATRSLESTGGSAPGVWGSDNGMSGRRG